MLLRGAALSKGKGRAAAGLGQGRAAATVLATRQLHASPRRLDKDQQDDFELDQNDFILSILNANPSLRDSRSYLASFGSLPPSKTPKTESSSSKDTKPTTNALVSSLLNPARPHTALVKIQGPFTDRQLDAICRGMVYLQKLGLVSVIVVDRDDWGPDQIKTREAREEALREMERVVDVLVRLGSEARPILQTPVWIGEDGEMRVDREELEGVTEAVRAGEIPVLPPLAMEVTEGGGLRVSRVDANGVVKALVVAMVQAGKESKQAELDFLATEDALPSSAGTELATSSDDASEDSSSPLPLPIPLKSSTTLLALSRPLDLTPFRLMIINREGGIPSYARSGLPHLTINLSSEYNFINSTFLPSWSLTHPTSLRNLQLSQSCLTLMPRSSSALIVSHRSPRSLIANLITNKPAHSPSLPHALLDSTGRLTKDTPTLIRKGLELKIVRKVGEFDQKKMTRLLEESFGRKLDEERFYGRLEKHLDFVIVAGDYAGAAIVTNEWEAEEEEGSDFIDASPSSSSPSPPSPQTPPPTRPTPVCYLDKFAVLPSHQGDGTVDFLWSALRDESFGSALPSALNSTPGSIAGTVPASGGRDLVWRSRSDNPVNKWYFERSNGFIRLGGQGGKFKLFWCDREEARGGEEEDGTDESDGFEVGGGPRRPREEEGLLGQRKEEIGRLGRWERVVEPIPSAWAY
ncbi:hypothetical protein BDY24DRAFT_390784 [Mrakia frigida]|uniref:acetyl-CoA:L-glutamate N-acetyltransferase n=1 Tax=Mrakia frigida TaxID=29902 RepID=UPI003FCBFE71